MQLPQSFLEFIAKEKLFAAADRLLIAVSGGVDSVVLCELCERAGFDFVMAHCNFQLRGDASEGDEAFVRRLTDRYRKPVLVKKFDTAAYAAGNKVSVQVAARELRYDWFYSIAQQPLDFSGVPANWQATRILTAHHLDDNIETLLMNFFKGTGIAGLRGMLPLQGILARPLLFARKEQLLAFAQEAKLDWVEDASNQSDKYARNYFRNKLIPMAAQVFPSAEANLAQNLPRFRDIETLYRQSIDRWKKKLVTFKNNEMMLPVLKLKQAAPLSSILYEICKEYGFGSAQIQDILHLLESPTGRYVISSTHRILRNRNWLIIAPLNNAQADTVLIEGAGTLQIAGGKLELTLLDQPPATLPASATTACLDASDIRFPLLLRTWKAGDYFYPLGMKKKKKLARFFIDQKLSATQKEKVRVLESNKKIIWVMGHRIDERFRLHAGSRKVLLLRFTASE